MKKGFTLLELLVVIAVIGILSSVVMVSLSNSKKKADTAFVKSEADQIKKALELYKDTNGIYGNYTASNYYSSLRPAGYTSVYAGAGDCYVPFARVNNDITNMVGQGMAHTNINPSVGLSMFWCAVSPDGQSYAIAFEGLKTGLGTYCVDSSGNVKESNYSWAPGLLNNPVTSISVNPVTCR